MPRPELGSRSTRRAPYHHKEFFDHNHNGNFSPGKDLPPPLTLSIKSARLLKRKKHHKAPSKIRSDDTNYTQLSMQVNSLAFDSNPREKETQSIQIDHEEEINPSINDVPPQRRREDMSRGALIRSQELELRELKTEIKHLTDARARLNGKGRNKAQKKMLDLPIKTIINQKRKEHAEELEKYDKLHQEKVIDSGPINLKKVFWDFCKLQL